MLNTPPGKQKTARLAGDPMYIGVQATEMWHQGLTNIRTQ
jgi:hypothetical protein